MVQPMPDNSSPPPLPSSLPRAADRGASTSAEACSTGNMLASDRVTIDRGSDREVVIPQIEETAEVTTRMIETGVVRIEKHVHDVERTFHPTLHDERIRVERIPVNRVVKTAPEVRTEGETTVIPVVEEVMVKLLLLKEEVRVTREVVNKPSEPQHVTLRREEVTVERHPAEVGSAPSPIPTQPAVQGTSRGGAPAPRNPM
jgi:hypothetical protein